MLYCNKSKIAGTLLTNLQQTLCRFNGHQFDVGHMLVICWSGLEIWNNIKVFLLFFVLLVLVSAVDCFAMQCCKDKICNSKVT